MRRLVLPLLLTLPLCAQKYDLRFEVPFPKGQSLPQTMLEGAGRLAASGSLDTGSGGLLTFSHRIVRVGPVLRLEWCAEISQLTANGTIETYPVIDPLDDPDLDPGTTTQSSRLKQTGLGVGVNAQLWVPLTGICGEIGAIQRIQRYSYSSGGNESDGTIGRTWLRVGARWRIPAVKIHPYLVASYQQPINKDNPVKLDSAHDLADLFKAQGKGQEFERMWTFGVGVTF